MRLTKNNILTILILGNSILNCATDTVDIKKENPNLYAEIIRDYPVASETNLGEENVLKFHEDEKHTITGKVDNFPIENCNWFFDKKMNKSDSEEKVTSVSKTINLNCGGQFYLIDFDRKNLSPAKIRYNGVYKKIFHQLNKALILEASCNKNAVAEKENDEKNTTIECYAYPYDLERYTKTQKREVVAGYFLFTDKQGSLSELLNSAKEEQNNDQIFENLKKNFKDEKSANNKEFNPYIGKNISFKNSEFIDFREIPIENAKGNSLKQKIDKLLESDLSDPNNKEALKDAIEEYKNCGKSCVSRDKEIQLIFEIRNREAKRKVILIKKIENKSEISQYKRFQMYTVEGNLYSIDFSAKGEIEKIFLNPESSNTNPSKEKKDSLNKSDSELEMRESELENIERSREENPKPKREKKNKKTETIEPQPNSD